MNSCLQILETGERPLIMAIYDIVLIILLCLFKFMYKILYKKVFGFSKVHRQFPICWDFSSNFFLL